MCGQTNKTHMGVAYFFNTEDMFNVGVPHASQLYII